MSILMCLLSLVLVQQPGQSEGGTISGQLRSITGAPAAGVRVFATTAETDGGALPALSNISETDNEGRFRLEGVLPGRYLIAAGLLSSPSYYPGVTTPDQAQIVTVATGQTITNLDFRVTFKSGLREVWGNIGIDDGSPLPVGMLQQFQLILSSSSAHWIAKPFTNTQGILVFQPDVKPGEYATTLAPPPLGYYLKSMTFGNVDLTTARLILGEGESNTRIQVVLTKTRPAGAPPGVRVSGRVTGRVLPMELTSISTVIDKIRPEEILNTVAFVSLQQDGSFGIEGVPPGRYMLRPRGGKRTLPFDVAGNDVANLELILETLGSPVALAPSSKTSISGKVEMGDGTIPQFEVGFTSTLPGAAATHAVTVSLNEFSILVPEGQYRVSISGLPKGYAVTSVTAGPLDLTQPFLVTSKGIADRFTGTPIRSDGPTTGTGVRMTVRLTTPSSGK